MKSFVLAAVSVSRWRAVPLHKPPIMRVDPRVLASSIGRGALDQLSK